MLSALDIDWTGGVGAQTSNVALTPVVVIGATTSHANQIDTEVKTFTFKVLSLPFTAWFSMVRRRGCRGYEIWH